MSFKDFNQKNKEDLNSRTAKFGGYSFIISVVVLAIIVAVNVLVSVLPTSLTQIDMSAAKYYSVTSQTKVVAGNLEDDITIYWITQDGEEDAYIKRLLAVYDDLSDHITVEKKNPDEYPEFASQYTEEDVANNSLVVENGDRNRYIAYEDLYDYELNYSTYSYDVTGFKGEAKITSAINYVTTEDLPKIYVLTGHNELSLETTSQFNTRIEDANYDVEDLTLLNIDEVPEDADMVMIYEPATDLSEDEVTKLQTYVTGGGKLFVVSGYVEEGLTNINKLLSNYNVTVEDGIVLESDSENYMSYPYILLPTINSSDLTDELIDAKSYIISYASLGLTVGEAGGDYTVTSLIDSSSTSFLKEATAESYEQDDDDKTGPFSLALTIEDNANSGKIVWFASNWMTTDDLYEYSSGANLDLAMNSLSWLVGDTDSISIASKTFETESLTLAEDEASRLTVILVAVLPLIFLVYGIIEVVDRHKKGSSKNDEIKEIEG